MSYDVDIERSGEPCGENSPGITLEEWKAAISHFPAFRHLRLEGADENHLGVWQMTDDDGIATNFYLTDGVAWASNPRRHALQRMYQLAQLLQAKVIGQNDEVYDEHGYPDRHTSYVPRDW